MQQYFDWPGAVEDVKRLMKHCHTCQKFKIIKKCGKVPLVPEKEEVPPPFPTVHLDMIGSWTIKFVRGKKKIKCEV